MNLKKGNTFKFIILLFTIAIINLSYAQINTPPIVTNDYDTVDFNTTLIVDAPGVLGNDTDNEGDLLIITQFTIDNINFVVAGQPLIISGIGTITIFADGSFEFVPDATYDGYVPDIYYTVSDGTDTSIGILFLTVERDDDLIEISNIRSCNQGYTADGDYKVTYSISISNISIARDDHLASQITNVNVTDNLQSVFGSGCVTLIDQFTASTSDTIDYINDPYPRDFNFLSLSSDFENLSSSVIFNNSAIANNILYPRQTININFCVTIDPTCVASNPINFNNIVNVTSTNGNGSVGSDSINLEISDFHTSETTVAANLFIEDISPIDGVGNVSDPDVEPNGTYDYTNTVIIKNDGSAIANNVNYNMGLGNFYDNGIVFSTLEISQESGSVVTNPLFNGDDESLMLTSGNSLNPGEVIILKVHYIVNPIASSGNASFFSQLRTSMTQGTADGQGATPDAVDEFSIVNRRKFSYVIWSDTQGNHLDRYYIAENETDEPSSNDQCQCGRLGMRFFYDFTTTVEKELIETNPAPSGILEHKELTFRVTIKNKSPFIEASNLQIQDNLDNICANHIVSVSSPIIDIDSSTATTNPNLNPLYNGITDINIFDGTSGLLEPPTITNPDFQKIVVEYKVIIIDDCDGVNKATFSSSDPLNNVNPVSSTVDVNVFSDNDNDGITNINDIDDDNDGVLDLDEYGGLDPLADADLDLIPNYRDTNFGVDINLDGIVDIFDFDYDGVPNHFDLDSDNDGITDIIEAGGIDNDNNGKVPVNSDDTLVLDADNDGLTDSLIVDTTGDGIADQAIDIDIGGVTIPTPDNDGTGLPNFLDIDADGDGIVDIIEAQPTDSYGAPNLVADLNGLVYASGLTPTDTEGDNVLDYLDVDCDNDGRLDYIEGWDTNNNGTPEITAINSDIDGDGLDDAFDLVANDGSQSSNATNNQIPTDFPNVNIPTTLERDWREKIAPVITITDSLVTEGDPLTFDITLSSPSSSPVVIEFSVTDQTTTIDQDYEFNSNIITFTIPVVDNQNIFFFIIETIDDDINELDFETLKLNAVVTSGNTANINLTNIGTIQDNDDPPTVIITNPIVVEGELMQFDVKLNRLNYLDVGLNIFTSNNTARQQEDYISVSTSVTIPALTFGKTIDVITVEDTFVEDTETLFLNGLVTTFNTINNNPIGEGTILDDDFPNLFSPNNDGFSDVFEIIALKPYGNFELQIFDRWGSEVYNYSNNGNPIPNWWDGTIKGKPVPEGVYYYTLDYNDGVTQPKSGFIQLIR